MRLHPGRVEAEDVRQHLVGAGQSRVEQRGARFEQGAKPGIWPIVCDGGDAEGRVGLVAPLDAAVVRDDQIQAIGKAGRDARPEPPVRS